VEIDALKSRLDRRPFIPFRIFLSDGRQFEVQRPDWTMVIPPFRRVFIARPEMGKGRYLPIEDVDCLHITSIEELPPANDAAA
jgi:hypothetical protein